ncbi:helix-turn-helix transcriptional regulator [Candidatus Pacearchaeota archaeon]|nr:helix-turn-helix transcriptional regulator [Candidatus Pacearchaeota archaeon]
MNNSHAKSRCNLFFETLGTRLKIDIITELKHEALNVNELARKLNQERSKVSHALLSLSECGFVNARKEGKRRIYSLNKETIIPLINLAERHVKKYCKACRKQRTERRKTK